MSDMSPPIAMPQITLFVGLSLLTALGYAAATVGMKLASIGLNWIGVAVIIAGFALAAIAEIILLHRFDLARTYVFIIAAESLLVLTAALCLGESLSPVQITGAVMVLIGLTLTLA